GVTGADFALECQMDKLASLIGMDPVEFRILNAYRDGDMKAHRRAAHNCALVECAQVAAEKAHWPIRDEYRAATSLTSAAPQPSLRPATPEPARPSITSTPQQPTLPPAPPPPRPSTSPTVQQSPPPTTSPQTAPPPTTPNQGGRTPRRPGVSRFSGLSGTRRR
ncbi:MAG: xanthine dehydrogenase family protein molybdopterin-binding subunit, partial [Geminicoccaceae bacterium]